MVVKLGPRSLICLGNINGHPFSQENIGWSIFHGNYGRSLVARRVVWRQRANRLKYHLGERSGSFTNVDFICLSYILFGLSVDDVLQLCYKLVMGQLCRCLIFGPLLVSFRKFDVLDSVQWILSIV